MSHVATVDIEITSLDDLRAACQRLGLEFVEGQTTYEWFGESVGDYPLPAGIEAHELGTCLHAIRIPPAKAREVAKRYGDDPYEVGVIQRRDGKPGYTLLWDFFHGGFGLQDYVGEGCAKLKQAYAVTAATRVARQQGFRVQETVGSDGKIKLQCVK